MLVFIYGALSGARFPFELAYYYKRNLAFKEFFYSETSGIDKRLFSSRKNCIRLKFVYSENIAREYLTSVKFALVFVLSA